jgi:CBS domain-containing protein
MRDARCANEKVRPEAIRRRRAIGPTQKCLHLVAGGGGGMAHDAAKPKWRCMQMFDYDVLEPGILVEPEALISRGKDLRRLAFLTPIYALPFKPPLFLSTDSTVAEAVQLMIEAEAGAALIVSDDELFGMITETDVLRLTRNPQIDLNRASALEAASAEPPPCLHTDNVAVALRNFKTYGVNYLPVVREDGTPFGVLDALAITHWISTELSVIVLDKVGLE